MIPARSAFGTTGFTAVPERFACPMLYNLHLAPRERHSCLTRKRAHFEAFQPGMRSHLATFGQFPARKVMGIKVADKRERNPARWNGKILLNAGPDCGPE